MNTTLPHRSLTSCRPSPGFAICALLGLLLFLLLPEWLQAQVFNTRNGRNHPELEWKVAETDHFKIIYPARLAGIEAKAAPIAEESYDALSSNLEVEFDKKIPIYLSDEDAISNGFAVPLGTGYTCIWVHVNDYADTWTGEVKWLRKVVSHELAHIFHFQATRTDLGLLQYLIGDPLPSFFTEGLAQYETEKWDSQRGDRWLRRAVFDDDLDYSGSSTVDSRLRYALGNSQLRYFAETYGDTTLADLLSKRQKRLGILPVHDFNESMRETIGKSYSGFYDEWRKHVNVYYNTLAGRMGRTDSLEEVGRIPGTWIRDLAVSPDERHTAVLSVSSDRRPVTRLSLVPADTAESVRVLTEGSVGDDLVWSPDNRILAYSRQVRGEHGSLVPDLFTYDMEADQERRLTRSRRAAWPAFSQRGDTLAFVATEGGTANIWLRRIADGSEERLTDYTGDVQLVHLAWNRARNELIYHRFDEEGNRNLVVHELETGRSYEIDDGETDNRRPVVSPSGNRIAFTSLRDEVPNIFVYDYAAGETRRATDLFTGGEAMAWLSADSSYDAGRLWVKATESKESDDVRVADASASPEEPPSPDSVPYSGWRGELPPSVIDWQIDEDASLVTGRGDYRPLANLTHAVSFGFPWYESKGEFGITGFTSFAEPLGKHLLVGGGYLSATDPVDNTRGVLSYVNNTLTPTVEFSVYRTPATARWYRSEFLVEEHAGGEVSATWPVELSWRSYQSSSFNARLRWFQTDPLEVQRFSDLPPLKAEQADLRLGWAWKSQKPWENNGIHPLDGTGVRLTLLGAADVLGGDTRYLQPDLSAYTVLPALGMHRVFVYGRYQGQYGDALPQEYVGFSRYDNIEFPLPDEIDFLFESHVERVRGYREFVAGKHVAFGSLEYRMPFLPSLQTQVLGLIGLGQTTLSLFADAGKVWDASAGVETTRLGAGGEIKNRIRLGPLTFTHALGIAQPYDHLFGDSTYDLYYRVRAAVPF